MTGALHIPVLLDEVIAALAPRPGEIIVDATFGAGGYSRALLDAGATVHAFDRDPDAIALGKSWPETEENPPRLVLHHAGALDRGPAGRRDPRGMMRRCPR